MEDREDQAPFRTEHAVQLPNRNQWGGDEWERQIADDSMEGAVFEEEDPASNPVRTHSAVRVGGS